METHRSALILALISCLVAMACSQTPGGLKDEMPADEHVRGIMDKAMSKLQSGYPGGFKSMEPISYRTQVVAGTNYFVKVKVTDNSGNTKPAHVRLYRHWKGDIEVHAIKTDVTEVSPLKYFQAS